MKDLQSRLRDDYQTVLRKHRLAWRSVPTDALEIERRTLAQILRLERATGNRERARLLREVGRARMASPRVDPVQESLDRIARSVEESIERIPRYRAAFPKDVFVGDFPIGTFNARVMRTPNGYLILVNSGLPVLIQALMHAVNLTEDLSKCAEDDNIVALVKAIVVHYLQSREPIGGPLPIAPGPGGMLAFRMKRACELFVLGHEYAHRLLGHLSANESPTEVLNTSSGQLSVVATNWDMELAADRGAYHLLIGTEDPAQLDFDIVERALAGSHEAFGHAVDLMCSVAAPLTCFAIDVLIATVRKAIGGGEVQHSMTHPDVETRIKAFLPLLDLVPERCRRYLWHGSALLAISDKLAAPWARI